MAPKKSKATPKATKFINTRMRFTRTAAGEPRTYRLADPDQPSTHDVLFTNIYGRLEYHRLADNDKETPKHQNSQRFKFCRGKDGKWNHVKRMPSGRFRITKDNKGGVTIVKA